MLLNQILTAFVSICMGYVGCKLNEIQTLAVTTRVYCVGRTEIIFAKELTARPFKRSCDGGSFAIKF